MVLNQSEKGNYNPNLVLIDQVQDRSQLQSQHVTRRFPSYFLFTFLLYFLLLCYYPQLVLSNFLPYLLWLLAVFILLSLNNNNNSRANYSELESRNEVKKVLLICTKYQRQNVNHKNRKIDFAFVPAHCASYL